MYLVIKPQDTLFFRSGRPFTMGAETWADCIFPPSPSTFYGALRAFLIFERADLVKFLKNEKVEGIFEDIGTPKEKGSLKICGEFVYNEKLQAIYFPIPADLVKSKHKQKNKLLRLSLEKKPDYIYSDYPLEMCLFFKENEKIEEAFGFIDNLFLKDYLEGKTEEIPFIEMEKILSLEPKIGIKREPITKTSEEEHIYRIQMIRLKEDFGFLLKIEGVKNLPEKGVLQLGGEGKLAEFKVLKEEVLKDLENIQFSLKDGIFKLYFATSAIFKNGWLPEGVKEDYTWEINGLKLKLVAVALKKHKLLGGWDMAENKPKPMYRVVPEGSVYYFKVLNGADEEKIKEVFHFKNISDILPEEGFGLTLVGGV